jgi:anaerobic selenocysteine-containing dehydrogenase
MSELSQMKTPDTISTVCPRNCYSTCSFKVRIREGEIIGIDKHPGNAATPEGPCIKGLAYVERNSSKDRILQPMQREKSGLFKAISWDEAIETIADRLKHFRKEFGPHSILFFAASGMSGLLNEVSTAFWKLFGGASTTYGNLCWPAGLEATRLTLGANNHNAPWDLENARLIILWGKNPAESNIQEMLHIDRALKSGGKLVVIDPRRTASSDRAQLLFQIRPGTDGALALGIARELIHQGWIDQNFIETNVVGYKPFCESVEGYTIERISEICRIPQSGIQELAKLIGTTKPMTIIPGYGMQRYANGGQTIRCLLSLSVLTGNIGKPGACWHYANLQSYIFDEIKEPESYYPGGGNPKFRRKISVAKLGEDILKLSDPEIKMIWVERGNPLTQNPNSGSNLKAFRKAEFKVVVEQFMTDTANEADIILPAKNMFEQSDIVGSYWNPYVQLKQKVVEPAGQVKPETEIYYLLAHALEMDPTLIKAHIPEPNDHSIEQYLKEKLKRFPELSWEGLKEGPQLASVYEEIPFSDYVFPTPSGRIELWSDQAQARWGVSPLPTFEPLNRDQDQYPLQLLSPNSKNRIHSQFGNLNIINQFEPEAILFMHPKDAVNRGINNSDLAMIFNEIGSSDVRIQYDYGLLEGTSVLTNGHWHSKGASPNLFTDGRETDIGHGTAFHDTWIEVKKA